MCVSLAGVGVSPHLCDVAVPSGQGQEGDLELHREFSSVSVMKEAPSFSPSQDYLSVLLRLDDVHVCECRPDVTLNHEVVEVIVGVLQVEAEVADHSVDHVNEVGVLCVVADVPNRCLCRVGGGNEVFHSQCVCVFLCVYQR